MGRNLPPAELCEALFDANTELLSAILQRDPCLVFAPFCSGKLKRTAKDREISEVFIEYYRQENESVSILNLHAARKIRFKERKTKEHGFSTWAENTLVARVYREKTHWDWLYSPSHVKIREKLFSFGVSKWFIQGAKDHWRLDLTPERRSLLFGGEMISERIIVKLFEKWAYLGILHLPDTCENDLDLVLSKPMISDNLSLSNLFVVHVKMKLGNMIAY